MRLYCTAFSRSPRYTSSLVYPEDLGTESNYFTDSDVSSYQDSTWYGSGSSWLKVGGGQSILEEPGARCVPGG